MPLKYLFTATFADGSRIAQTPEDRSSIDPEKRSAFFDVLEREKSTQLVSFTLIGDGHEYGVDLRDGHFEIDGVPFCMHEDEDLHGFRIVFYRRHTHHFLVGKETSHETEHLIVYRFGWQCTNGGKNYQHVMQID